MRSKRNRKQKPLFYINQPEMEMPLPVMQESFIYKKGEIEEGTETATEKLKTEILTIDAEISDESSETETLNNEPELEKVNKKKTFNELSLDEKIKHLKLVPASVAKVRYEFITIERSYHGYFLALNNGALIINSTNSRKKSVNILIEDLVDVKRIGL